jgi:hypothetical protein
VDPLGLARHHRGGSPLQSQLDRLWRAGQGAVNFVKGLVFRTKMQPDTPTWRDAHPYYRPHLTRGGRYVKEITDEYVGQMATGALTVATVGLGRGASCVGNVPLGPRALPAPRQIPAEWSAATYNHGGLTTGIEHIMYRHGAKSAFTGVSRFSPATTAKDVLRYVDEALRYGRVVPNGQGAFVVEHSFARVIGTDRYGVATRSLRVHVRGGVIQTAHPL